MAGTVTIVLDTTVAETGPTQTIEDTFLKEDIPLRFSIAGDIAAGDTIVIEGKAEAADNFEILHTFADDSPVDVFVSRLWQVRRSVDGAVGDTTVKVHTPFNNKITVHT